MFIWFILLPHFLFKKCHSCLCEQRICAQKHSHSLHFKILETFSYICFSLKIAFYLLPSGVTFSFFWKTQDQQAKFPPASGGQVISSGFKICSNEGEGSVEFYTRGNAMMKWKASFSPPGKFFFFFLHAFF